MSLSGFCRVSGLTSSGDVCVGECHGDSVI